MMEKKRYEPPQIEIILFDTEDMITCSTEVGEDDLLTSLSPEGLEDGNP